MSVLLFVVGAIAAMVGVGMVGYGIPINEFSFGNTLIVAGTTAVVGGLIVIAIGAAVGNCSGSPRRWRRARRCGPAGQSKCLNRRLARARPRCRAEFRFRPSRNPRRLSAKRSRSPKRPSKTTRPLPRRRRCEIRIGRSPWSRNSNSRNTRMFRYRRNNRCPRRPRSSGTSRRRLRRSATMLFRWPECARSRPSMRLGVRRRRRSRWSANLSRAISMPCGRRNPGRRNARSLTRPKPEPKPDLAPVPAPEAPSEPVAILKSGVVDGMAYTLYVDGSIEAELPQGTLHFASINELREPSREEFVGNQTDRRIPPARAAGGFILGSAPQRNAKSNRVFDDLLLAATEIQPVDIQRNSHRASIFFRRTTLDQPGSMVFF